MDFFIKYAKEDKTYDYYNIRSSACEQLMNYYQNKDFNSGIESYNKDMYGEAMFYFDRLTNVGVKLPILDFLNGISIQHSDQTLLYADSPLVFFERFLIENKDSNIISERIIQWGLYEGEECFLHTVDLMDYDIRKEKSELEIIRLGSGKTEGPLHRELERRIEVYLPNLYEAFFWHFESIEKIAKIAIEKGYSRAIRQIVFYLLNDMETGKQCMTEPLYNKVYQKSQHIYNTLVIGGVDCKQLEKEYVMLFDEVQKKSRKLEKLMNKGIRDTDLFINILTLRSKLCIPSRRFDSAEKIRKQELDLKRKFLEYPY